MKPIVLGLSLFAICLLTCGEVRLVEKMGPATGVNSPFGVAFDNKGNAYIAEFEGGRILKLDKEGKLQTFSGNGKKGYAGDGLSADKGVFNSMHNLAWASGNFLYISDTNNELVRKINCNNYRLSTLAGTPNKKGFSGDKGLAEEAKLNMPISISLTPDEKTLLIADIRNRRIRAVNLESGTIRTIAGNGKKGKPIDGKLTLEQPLMDPRAAVMDHEGNLFVLERNGHALRVIHPDGKIYTLAGTGKKGQRDGPALQATFNGPKHLCLDRKGRIVIADDNNHLIRLYDPKTKSVSTILGGKAKPQTTLNRPHGVSIAPDGSLWVCDSWNNRVLSLSNY
jgi:sugar lactone lactonase YvrE